MEEKRDCNSCSESTDESFHFVSCANLKQEDAGAVDGKVGEEPSGSEPEVQLKAEGGEAGTFEEIAITECDVHIKEEVDEAAAPELEQDPLQIEEDEVCAATGKAARGRRSMRTSNPKRSTPRAAAIEQKAAHNQLQVSSASSKESTSRGRPLGGRSSRPTSSLVAGERYGFTCSSCQQTFRLKYTLVKHVFTHIDAVKPPQHVCRLCGEVFSMQHHLNMHMNMKENRCVVAKKVHLCTSKKQGKGPSQKNILCPRGTVRDVRENVSLKSGDASFCAAQYILKTQISDTYSCQKSISKDAILPKCKDSYTGKCPKPHDTSNTSLVSCNRLKRHVIPHSVDPLYYCKDCGRSFKYQVHLQQHTAIHRKKLHKCDDCGRAFNRLCDLRQHTLSHTGEKPHVCKCGKSYAKLYSLKRHEILHRRERPFQCDVCFKTFTDASVLKKHGLVHTGERSFHCEECGKSFKEFCYLKRHSVVHTGEKPYVCLECGKRFTQPGTLKTHSRMHTGEKPYTCSVCSKSFADRSNWRVHSASSHRIRPHKCEMCGRRFIKRGDLIKHVGEHIL